MRRLIREFVQFPFYANIFIVFLLVAGSVGYLSMKKSFFPERTSREISISVFYPGASPQQMEEGVTTRIEQAIRGIVGIKEFSSTSSENLARVQITTTGEYDLDETLMEVKNAVDGISSFPTAAERPIVFKQRSVSQAMFLSLAGETDVLTLKKYADQIEDDFLSSGVISQMGIFGYPGMEISVEISEEQLMRFNLTMNDLITAIASTNQDVAAGLVKSPEEEILVRIRNRSVDPNEIGDIILRAGNTGEFIRIRDVAEVKTKFEDVPIEYTLNGKQAVSISVQKLPEEDLDKITEYVDQYVEEFNAQHDHITLKETFNFLTVLHSRLELLYRNGGVGLFLVVLTLAFFLSFRLSLWVAWGIPASFLGMFLVAAMYGITINMISLFGMILVIGILVDDGIVIAENIYSHFEEGKTPKRAAIDGTLEVLPAVLTSVSTTVVAFSPLFFVREGGLDFMFEMAFVVAASLIISLFEAFFVLPAHLGNHRVLRPLNGNSPGQRLRKTFDRFVFFMRDRIYGKVLRVVVKYSWFFVFLPIFVIFFTVGLVRGGFIKVTFFPPVSFDFFNIDLAFKPGEGEAQTVKFLKNFEDLTWEVNEELKEKYNDDEDFVTYTFLNVGNAFNGQEAGSHSGNIRVILRDMEGAPVNSFQIINMIRDKIGEVPEAQKLAVGGNSRFGKPVSISLLGKNIEELAAAKEFMENRLKEFSELKDITDNNTPGKQEVQLELKPKAYFLGLNQNYIANQVRQAFFGGQAQRLQKGKDELRVYVRYPKEDRMRLGQLEDMKIKTPAGYYPLTELADYKIDRGPVSIKRYNSKREIRVEADTKDPLEPVPAIIERINTNILPQMKAKYPGVDIEYQGQERRSRESVAEVQKYYIIAFLVIILILMLHFKSWQQALIVLLMIPLAWLGAAWGHGLEGIPLSMLSVWGMVAVSGVIVNDAVVFLAKYNRFLLEGMHVKEAIIKAGLVRFRPIVLTTITTTIGLYPLILENSFQAQFLIPMAVALAYGVFIGTGFILIFFPVLIGVLNDLRRVAIWLTTNRKEMPSPDEVEIIIINEKKKIQ
ncbi:MAG: AcrB/AcrD/AcrF family protein [Salinivirgaceae bacterium]|nr:MAG: AcrB/AcrD/AcrF family protein [Salinivirgaceae bacterium]